MLICQTKYHASLYFINNHAPNALSTSSNIKTNILSEIFYFNFTFILYLHFIIYCVQKSFKVLKCITRKLVILHRYMWQHTKSVKLWDMQACVIYINVCVKFTCMCLLHFDWKFKMCDGLKMQISQCCDPGKIFK